jgi:hypothetical protein
MPGGEADEGKGANYLVSRGFGSRVWRSSPREAALRGAAPCKSWHIPRQWPRPKRSPGQGYGLAMDGHLRGIADPVHDRPNGRSARVHTMTTPPRTLAISTASLNQVTMASRMG